MVGYIYALKDRGFDRGIKIGRDSNFPTRFQRAQCYSPRGIDLVAAWRIDGDTFRCIGKLREDRVVPFGQYIAGMNN